MALQRPLASDYRAAGSVNVRSRACGALALSPRCTRIANTARCCRGSHRSPAAYARQGGQRKQLINPAAAVDAAAAAAEALIAEPLSADCLLHSETAAAGAAEGIQHSLADAGSLATTDSRANGSVTATCSDAAATAERWLSHSQASTSGRSSTLDDIEGMASPVQLHLAAAHLPTTLYVNSGSNGHGRSHRQQQHHQRQQQQQWQWWQHQQQQQQQQQQDEQHSNGNGGRPQVQEHDHHHLQTSTGQQQRANSGTAAGPGRPPLSPAAATTAAAAAAAAEGLTVSEEASGAASRSLHTAARTAAAGAVAGHGAGAPWSARLLRPAAAPLRPGCACSPSHISALAAALRVSPRAVEPLLRLQPELSAHDPASISSRVEALSAALGCSQRQAAAMVASHPACYLQQPLEVLEGRAQQLGAVLGLSQQQVVAWAAATPSVLKRAPAVVADRVQRVAAWLDAPAPDVVAAVQAAPELLTVRLTAARRRAGLLQRLLLLKQEVQVRRLVLAAPQLLFVSPRIVLSKVRVLMGIFQKDRRAVGRLVYTTPQLLACNLNHLRTSYQQLQLRLQRSAGYVFAMCCHSADLLLLRGPLLAARVAAVCQVAALVPTWGEEWGGLKPPQTHACLAAGRGRYARLQYLLLTQQAQQVGLQQALLTPAAQWQQQFPDYAAWVQAATQQQQQQQQWRQGDYKHTLGGAQVSSSSSNSPPGSALAGSRAQPHQQPQPPPTKLVSYQQLQQQWVQRWQTGASRHQSWSQQLSCWDKLQRAQQQELRRHQQQAAWLASGEQQQQARRASSQHKRRRDRQQQAEQQQQQQQQQQQTPQGRLAGGAGVAPSGGASGQEAATAAPVAAGTAGMSAWSDSSSSGGGNGRTAAVGPTAGFDAAQAATQAPSAAPGVQSAPQPSAAPDTPTSSSYGDVGASVGAEASCVTASSGAEVGVYTRSVKSAGDSESDVGEVAAAAQALESPEPLQQSVAAAEEVQAANAPKPSGAGTVRPRLRSNPGVSSMGQYRAAPGRLVQRVPQQQYGQQQQQQQLSVVHASHSFGLSVE